MSRQQPVHAHVDPVARLRPVVESVTSFDAIARRADLWRDLSARDARSGLFLSWDWMRDSLAANPGRWRLLILRDPGPRGRFLALLPLKSRLHWSTTQQLCQTQYEAAGRLSGAEYAGILCDPAVEAGAVAALAEAVARLPWGRLSLRYVPDDNRVARFAARLDPAVFDARFSDYRINGGKTNNLVSPRIVLPARAEDWLDAGPSANTRQKIRRFTRRYIDTGEMHVTETTPSTLDRDLTLLFRFWRARWEPVKGGVKARDIAGRYRTTLETAARIGTLYLAVLWQGARAVNSIGCVVDRDAGQVHFLIGGRDETVDNPATGLLLHAHAIRWAIAQGLSHYDFGHGDEPYKYSFGAQDRSTLYLEVRRRDPARDVFDPANTQLAIKRLDRFLAVGDIEAARKISRQLVNPGAGPHQSALSGHSSSTGHADAPALNRAGSAGGSDS